MLRVEDIAEDKFLAYDIETDGVYAPYCELKMIGYQLGINGEPQLVDPNSKESMEAFRELVNSDIIKVGFNNINFDDIVLWRYGFYVNPKNRHDMYLALKTRHPTFPSYSLKFANWWIDADQTPREAYHYWEQDMLGWMRRNYREDRLYQSVPIEMLGKYCMHDVRETVNVFRAVWEEIQEDQHWRPYTTLELAMGEPLHEMMLLGRELIDTNDIKRRIAEEKERLVEKNVEVRKLSKGWIRNVLSTKQVTRYLHTEYGVDFEVSELGNRLGRKSDWLKLMDEGFEGKSEIARCIYEARDASKVIGYLRSYLHAGRYERQWQRRVSANGQGKNGGFYPVDFTGCYEQGRNRNKRSKVPGDNGENNFLVSIPKSYGLSAARTRRFRSSSRFTYTNNKGEEVTFGINWQNQNKRSKVVQLVPKGWLGFWLDSTQIENVVHIWASGDDVRRAAYEADPNWNEYVWLSNMIVGGDLTREDLDKVDSTVNPSWSIYKQYKTIKLALNFGMGPDKFAKETGLKIELAIKEFDKVHKACPAIRRLQRIVREAIVDDKYVEDPFGHIYSGRKEEAYKIVAYLVQGCGTGSVPKAMTVANYESIHSLDSDSPICSPYVRHPYTERYSYGVLCGTTHDECSGRISLGLPNKLIVKLIKELLYNMEGKFSSYFDGIPLRAKLAISITNAAEQEELDHRKNDFEDRLIAYIEKGRKQ